MNPVKLVNFVVLLPPLIFASLFTLVFAQDQPSSEVEKQAPIIVREQTIYVPYENLRKTFEQEGRGVYLPYEQFRQLWDEAQKGREVLKPQSLASPIPFMITESVNEATVSEEIVKVESKIRIELLRKGWVEVPLRLNGVAISKAELGGEPARLLGNTGEGFRVLLEGKNAGKDAKKNEKSAENKEENENFSQSLELVLHYAKAIEKTPGRNSVLFEVPQAPISRWKVRVPESDVKIDFSPFIAVTEEKTEETPEESVLLAFAGGAPTVQIAWTPRAEGATGLEALTSVQMEKKVSLEEGTIRTEARLDYTISRSQIEKLAIEIPGDQKVLEVFDPNIRRWTVEPLEGRQVLNVDLFEPAKAAQTVNLKLERFLETDSDSPNNAAVEIPRIVAVGVARQQGVLVVQASEEILTDPQRTTGLIQMDDSELPQPLRGTKWNHAYRVSSSNYGLALSMAKILPRITASSRVQLQITGDNRLDMVYTMRVQYQIERAGVFQLTCDIPEGWTVSSVRGIPGNGMSGMNPIEIESHNIDKSDQESMQRLTVNLARKAVGNIGLSVLLSKTLRDTNLSSPEGKPLEFTLIPPVVAKDSIANGEMRFLVSTSENLQVLSNRPVGLQAVPAELLQREGGYVDYGGTHLAFVGGEEPASIELKIQQRKPQVTIRQVLQTHVETGVVKYTARFYYTVLYSGVKSLRIDIPETIAGKIRNPARTVRDAKMETQPEDVEEGYIAYQYEKDGDWFGSGMFELTWEEEIKRLEVGIGVPVSVPRLIPRNTDRSFGQILLSHAETISLRESEEPRGLRAIDPQNEVPPQDRVAAAATAMEFFEDWQLDLIATRFQNEEVKRASIEEGLLQVVSVRSSENLTARAVYRIRSVKQRIGVTLPDGAVVNEVRINGRLVALESDREQADNGKSRLYLIPLNSVTPDTPFLLELRYMYPGTVASISVPAFPGESLDAAGSIPAVQNMSLIVYVPDDSVVVHYKGAWTPHFRYRAVLPVTRVENHPGIDTIIQNITQGRPPGNFSVAGNPYLFTTLQPGAGPKDVLRLITMKEKTLRGTVYGFLIIAALALAPFPWKIRLPIVILLAMLLLLGGIYCTITKMYLSQQKVFANMLWLIVLFWVVVSLYRWCREIYGGFRRTQPQSEQPQMPENTDLPQEEPPKISDGQNSVTQNTEGGN